jgi:D-xylose transport system permease protein
MTVTEVEISDGDAPSSASGGNRLSLSEGLRVWIDNVKAGEIGSLPVILGLLVITVIFQVQNDRFLSAQNLTNLIVQMAPVAVISTGVVFVLLIGEIDLSVGVTSGVGGVIIARLLIPDGNEVPFVVAALIAAAVVLGIGLLHGFFVAKLGVPSLIVTLATLFIGTGVVLSLAGQQGLIRIQDETVIDIANTFLSDGIGWLLAVLAVVLYAGSQFMADRANLAQGLTAQSWAAFGAKATIAAVFAFGTVAITNADRGFPLIGLILALIVVAWLTVAERTRFGRHIYAVGGNAEAARRAGINVDRVKIACFMIASFMAGCGGLVLASRLRSVDNSAGGGTLLLYSIAAAVIGGTSLFGGRGKVTSAVQGALVITAVESGMGLLGWPSDRKFIVTGCILLLAVTIDTVTRRARQTSGRA